MVLVWIFQFDKFNIGESFHFEYLCINWCLSYQTYSPKVNRKCTDITSREEKFSSCSLVWCMYSALGDGTWYSPWSCSKMNSVDAEILIFFQIIIMTAIVLLTLNIFWYHWRLALYQNYTTNFQWCWFVGAKKKMKINKNKQLLDTSIDTIFVVFGPIKWEWSHLTTSVTLLNENRAE